MAFFPKFRKLHFFRHKILQKSEKIYKIRAVFKKTGFFWHKKNTSGGLKWLSLGPTIAVGFSMAALEQRENSMISGGVPKTGENQNSQNFPLKGPFFDEKGQKKSAFFCFFLWKKREKKMYKLNDLLAQVCPKVFGETFGPRFFGGGEPKIFQKNAFFGKFQAFW